MKSCSTLPLGFLQYLTVTARFREGLMVQGYKFILSLDLCENPKEPRCVPSEEGPLVQDIFYVTLRNTKDNLVPTPKLVKGGNGYYFTQRERLFLQILTKL